MLAGRRHAWPLGANAIHNLPAVRTISFARVIPQLALKMARLPALFGGAMIAGLAYIQYQASRESWFLRNDGMEWDMLTMG